jgi:plastocyanin domain-containing protein
MKHLLIFLVATGFFTACSSPLKKSTATNSSKVIKVTVDGEGYSPSKIEVPQGQKEVTLIFTRTTDSTCANEVISEDQGVDKKLPLNKPVSITFDVESNAPVVFGCHMNKMHKGTITKK